MKRSTGSIIDLTDDDDDEPQKKAKPDVQDITGSDPAVPNLNYDYNNECNNYPHTNHININYTTNGNGNDFHPTPQQTAESEANKAYFHRLLFPGGLSVSADGIYQMPTSTIPGVYTPPNLRAAPRPFLPLPVPLAFPIPYPTEFDTTIFSQKHRPNSPSYSALPASSLFDNNDNNNNNNNHNTNGRQGFMFHIYDPQHKTSNNNNNNRVTFIPPIMDSTTTTTTTTNSAPVLIDLSNINDDDDEEVYFGNVQVDLVGLQHYSGVVSKGENVSIVRDATNPMDANSFVVHNVTNVQVGHVDGVQAAVLAPLVDASILRIEGLIPAPKGVEQMPLLVQCYGKVADRDFVISKLKPLGLEIGASIDKAELHKLQQNRVKIDKWNMQPDEMLSIPLSGDDLAQAEPPEGLVSPLYPHQRQALTWMLEHEKIRPSTLFWKKKGGSYFNSVTNSVVPTPPSDCRGGILGDEMGLGKTLEIISLILASKNADTAADIPNRPSLVVCPLSTLNNWSDQIARHCERNKLVVYLYHGAARTTDSTLLATYDIVVTTYNIIGLEFASNVRVASPLYSIVWKRVVLDEAHLIKNRTTQQSQAAWGRRADFKWCLTGTPIQNKIDDLYSLLRFIRLEPFTDHNWWNRLITRPIKNKDLIGFSRLKAILKHVILRRTKDKHIDLPTRTVYMQTLDFSVEERAYYDSLYRFGKFQFDQYAKSGSVLQHYAHVLELLLRLRQTCDHPELVPASTFSMSQQIGAESNQEDGSRRDVSEILKTGELDECCICMDKAIEPVATKCVHIFCKTCIFQAISMSGNTCPLCRAPVLPGELLPVKFTDNEEEKPNFTTHKSSKINALVLDLLSVRERDPTIKSIIFSQFTSFLDIIQNTLTENKITFARLDGKMSHEQRQTQLNRFETDPFVTVFLLSLKAGGVGLNLVSASRVYMMDPWWNPAVEDQAIDRVHRLGQTRPVEVIRFVIKGTVEEKIMKLQQRKMDMAASALEAKSKAELQEMRLDDLNLLFS